MTLSSIPSPAPWAVVTGASNGIGRAIAEEIAATGQPLVLVARDRNNLTELAAHLGSTAGVATRVVVADLSAPAGVASLVESTADLEVDTLVAAAGFGTAGDFLAIDGATELSMIDLNCRAVVELTRAYAAPMVERGRGTIVLFSSILAFQGVARSATYAATKGFVQVFGEGLKLELAPSGVDVIVTAPGPVATGFADRADMETGGAAAPRAVARATMRRIGKTTTVRPGARSLLLGTALRLLPRSLSSRVLSSVMSGFISHRAA